jgi:hypothetical protein
MVLVFSESSNQSDQVLNEVERAVSERLAIIPFRMAEVVPNDELKLYISAHHWLDAFAGPMDRHLKRLGDAIRILIDPNTKTRLGPAEATRHAISSTAIFDSNAASAQQENLKHGPCVNAVPDARPATPVDAGGRYNPDSGKVTRFVPPSAVPPAASKSPKQRRARSGTKAGSTSRTPSVPPPPAAHNAPARGKLPSAYRDRALVAAFAVICFSLFGILMHSGRSDELAKQVLTCVQTKDLAGLKDLLLNQNASTEARDPSTGDTPLIAAVSLPDCGEYVKALVSAGADLEAENRIGETALTVAAVSGDRDAVDVLLGDNQGAGTPRCANVNHARRTDGKTPLILAVQNCKADVVRKLVSKHASKDAKDKTEQSAAGIAANCDCTNADEIQTTLNVKPPD